MIFQIKHSKVFAKVIIIHNTMLHIFYSMWPQKFVTLVFQCGE
jgi:hypothetical protein